jgi:23S rRNA (guanosine2251-2'-O)-methyltransferase
MPVLEGRLSVLAALQARQRSFQAVLIRRDAADDRAAEVIAAAERADVPVRFVERQELEGLTHGTTHGGIVALVSPKPRLTPEHLPELLRYVAAPLLLLLEGIDDARNLGFVLRTADAVGCHAVLVKKHLWDLDETEVSRPSSGAYERLPLVQIDSVEPLERLKSQGVQLVGCLAGVRRTLWELDLCRPTLLAVGGEKRGLSGAVRAICDGFATIPTPGGASLSLSHASAILLGEAMRQRRAKNASQDAHP